MTSSYQKILKKITDTEKRLKPNQQDISALMDLEIEERNVMININKDDDVVEEYKTLKENISGGMTNRFSLAYQPIKINKRKWSHQDL